MTLQEAAFVTHLLAAVQADPVLMVSWASEKADLYSDYILLCCRRRTKTDSLAKNLTALRENLQARNALNWCGVRDDILLHDRSITELPMCACVRAEEGGARAQERVVIVGSPCEVCGRETLSTSGAARHHAC